MLTPNRRAVREHRGIQRETTKRDYKGRLQREGPKRSRRATQKSEAGRNNTSRAKRDRRSPEINTYRTSNIRILVYSHANHIVHVSDRQKQNSLQESGVEWAP
jgi:hypothetical protein